MFRLSATRRSLVPAAVLLAVAAIAVIAVACGGDSDDQATPEGVPSPEATASEEVFSPTDTSGIIGADPEFNFAALMWQGYWLSRDHFGPFVMQSGMGITFEPPMEMLQAAMAMVAQNPDDQPFLPKNMAPLQAVFASGDPSAIHDVTQIPPDDFSQFRFDPETFDTTIEVAAMAQTMLKESQWARNFANAHFGALDGDFGAQQRFVGVMVNLLAQMQGKYAMENLQGGDGLYLDSDGDLDYVGNWTLLQAFSDIAGLTADASSRYHDPEAAPMWQGAAGALFAALEDRDAADPKEATSAIRALAYYAWVSPDSDEGSRALDKARELGEVLLDVAPEDNVAKAASLWGLIQVGEIEADTRYSDKAAERFEELQADFDFQYGVFRSIDRYTADDVAWLLSGLSAVSQRGPDAQRGPASKTLMAFFESVMDQSGLQLSAPPGKNGAMAGEFEKSLPSVVYYHGAQTPPPPAAGGEFGKAPVPASEVEWDGSRWQVTNDRFTTAWAMHLANELNWLVPHLGSVPFPPVSR
ncbi:MAG: hypothetical protein V3S20_09490 [Dehalococcoidia bacterium]